MILLFLLLFNHIVNIKLEEPLAKCSVGYFRKQDSTCEECSSFCLKNFTSVNFPKDCIEPCKNHVNNTVTDYSKSNKPIIEISTTVQNYVNNTNTNNSKTNIKLGVIFGVIIVICVIVGIFVFIIYKKRKFGKFSPLNKINSPHLSNSNTHPVSMNDKSGKFGKFSPLNKINSPHLSNSNNNTHPVSMNDLSDRIETTHENNRSNDIESMISSRSLDRLNENNECGEEDQSAGFNSSLHVNSMNNIDNADSDSMNNVPENLEKNGRKIEDNSSNDIESENECSDMISGQLINTIPYLTARR